MRDKISEVRLSLLHPKARDIFKYFIEECEEKNNITLRIVQGLRTWEEQKQIYAQGRTLPGKIVSHAPPGKSWHNYGLAIDIVEIKEKKANWMVNYNLFENAAKKFGLVWGGRFVVKGKPFPDKPHYQITFGYKIGQVLEKYEKGDFISGTKYVNI